MDLCILYIEWEITFCAWWEGKKKILNLVWYMIMMGQVGSKMARIRKQRACLPFSKHHMGWCDNPILGATWAAASYSTSPLSLAPHLLSPTVFGIFFKTAIENYFVVFLNISFLEFASIFQVFVFICILTSTKQTMSLLRSNFWKGHFVMFYH